MKPLRFCFITTFYPPWAFGGDGMAVQRLARALVGRGHHVTVIHDIDAWKVLAPPGGEPPAPRDDGVERIGLRSRLGPFSSILTHQTGRPVVHGGRIRQVVESGRYDVLHFHNISLVGGPGVLSVGRDVPKLYTAHEHWLVCPMHVLWRHNREPCTGRECFRCALAHRRPPQLYRHTGYMERQLDEVDVFIALSEFSRRKHKEFGFPRDMTVLPPLLGDGDDGPATLPCPESPHPRPYVLFAGRLERMKGLDDVIPVFGGSDGVDLLIAGEGGHGDALRRLAGDAPGVRFLGWVAPDELRCHVQHALAVLAPSVGFETFGLTLVEAFRDGRPVLARRQGPYPELVQRSGGGLLFSSPDELRTALRTLTTDPDGTAALGAAGRVAFQRYWSEEAVLPRYLELVRGAMERKAGRLDSAGPSREEVECAPS